MKENSSEDPFMFIFRASANEITRVCLLINLLRNALLGAVRERRRKCAFRVNCSTDARSRLVHISYQYRTYEHVVSRANRMFVCRAETKDGEWLKTGDIGTWLPSGNLKIIDRKKVMCFNDLICVLLTSISPEGPSFDATCFCCGQRSAPNGVL